MSAVAFHTSSEDEVSGISLVVVVLMDSRSIIGIAESYHQCSLGGLNAKTVDEADGQCISHLICGAVVLEHNQLNVVLAHRKSNK
jgi:hypothetical protein